LELSICTVLCLAIWDTSMAERAVAGTAQQIAAARPNAGIIGENDCMAKIKIEPKDRPNVKVECLRLLVTLKLDPARIFLISSFVDIYTYLWLNASEELAFRAEIANVQMTQA
jgi:flagellar biosynthesis protein FliP